MHCIWRLPEGDRDNASRWRYIKQLFARQIALTEWRSASRFTRHERGIRQRRFWEHPIRDERDLRRHIDYIHFNPFKHGHVQRVADWPYSTFHRYVHQGAYVKDWCG
jgi:putative transposase